MRVENTSDKEVYLILVLTANKIKSYNMIIIIIHKK